MNDISGCSGDINRWQRKKERDTKQRMDYGYTIDMSKQNKRNSMHIHDDDDGDLNRCTGDQARVWNEQKKKPLKTEKTIKSIKTTKEGDQ